MIPRHETLWKAVTFDQLKFVNNSSPIALKDDIFCDLHPRHPAPTEVLAPE
jgi:hypothetical protein